MCRWWRVFGQEAEGDLLAIWFHIHCVKINSLAVVKVAMMIFLTSSNADWWEPGLLGRCTVCSAQLLVIWENLQLFPVIFFFVFYQKKDKLRKGVILHYWGGLSGREEMPTSLGWVAVEVWAQAHSLTIDRVFILWTYSVVVFDFFFFSPLSKVAKGGCCIGQCQNRSALIVAS